MPSIFLIWAELKGKACGPDPRVTTLKSWCGQQPVEERLKLPQRDTVSSSAYVCVCVSSRLSSSWFGGFYASTQIETSAGGTRSTSPPWKPLRHPSFSCPVTETVFFCQMRKSRSINRNSCQERAGGVFGENVLLPLMKRLFLTYVNFFRDRWTQDRPRLNMHKAPVMSAIVQVSRGFFGAQVQWGETSVMLPVRQTLRNCLFLKIVKTSWHPLLISGLGKWKWPYLDKRVDIIIYKANIVLYWTRL